jgi:hypothetical protein
MASTSTNSLLSILNERRFFTGSASIQVPLSSLYAATNEIPKAEAAYADFKRLYPSGGSLQSEIGLSRLDVVKHGEFATARGQARLSIPRQPRVTYALVSDQENPLCPVSGDQFS